MAGGFGDHEARKPEGVLKEAMHYLSLLLGGGDGDLSGTYLGDPTNLTILDTFSCFLFNVCWTTKLLRMIRPVAILK